MAGSKGKPFSVADLKAGVGCIGLTASPGRAATTALVDAAGQIDTAPATR